jgi:hypothetical protein
MSTLHLQVELFNMDIYPSQAAMQCKKNMMKGEKKKN